MNDCLYHRAKETAPASRGVAAMTGRASRFLALLLASTGMAGCDLIFSTTPESSDPLMSREAVATREAPEELVFHGQLAGHPAFLLIHDCEVYSVERRENGGVRWESVLAPEFYPFWTTCQRQSMAFKDGALTVTLGRMALGAGGCCATGGTYRSTDGRTWKKVS